MRYAWPFVRYILGAGAASVIICAIIVIISARIVFTGIIIGIIFAIIFIIFVFRNI